MQIVGTMRRTLRALKYPYFSECVRGVMDGKFPIFVKYPVHPRQRYGFGKPPHRQIYALLDAQRCAIREQLEAFRQFESDFLRIPDHDDPHGIQPYWNNGFFPGLDAMALYAFLAIEQPKLYIEIGSGNSTKFARRAITDHKLDTRIVSIDPFPRAEIDSISDEVIRKPLETIDLGVFNQVTGDDIVFFDGSHLSFMNSDVTTFFLEVMPATPANTLIHIHDIYLPNDYPPPRTLHYESEQYLLAAMLLGGCNRFDVIMPNNFVEQQEDLCGVFAGFWQQRSAVVKYGSSFWLRHRGEPAA